jgi:TRAP-type mannitol/chloroaromatic compound transport system permease large subunit
MKSFAAPCLGFGGGGVGVVVVDVVVVVRLVVVVVVLVVGDVFAGEAPPFDAAAMAAGVSTMAARKARTRPRVRDIKGH